MAKKAAKKAAKKEPFKAAELVVLRQMLAAPAVKKGAKRGINIGVVLALVDKLPVFISVMQQLIAAWQASHPPKPPTPPVPPVPPDPPKPPDPPRPPDPVPPNPPDPPVPGDDQCPQPYTLKLGLRDQRKLALGWRTTFDVTPMVRGACAHKGDPSPTAVCAVSEECGPVYQSRYGQVEAFQTGTGFTNDPVERSSANSFILVISTNSEADWAGGKFKAAGPMTLKVTYSFLDHYRAQSFSMGTDGKINGAGNNSTAVDIPK